MNNLITKLKSYNYKNSEEETLEKIINFVLKNKENSVNRDFFRDGHLTGSALLLNPKMDKVLLTHHKQFNSWLQLGGHSENDFDIQNVALREAIEESGIDDVRFFSDDILDIDIHEISARPSKNEPNHIHYDIVFLLIAGNENFIISDESNDLKWFSFSEARRVGNKGLIKMLDKAEIIISSIKN